MITGGVVLAAGSVTSASLFQVPPGPATLLLANAGTAPVVYAGPGTNVSAATGFPISSGVVSPVVVPVYPGCPAGTWSVITAAGSATVSWIVSGPSGGTGY